MDMWHEVLNDLNEYGDPHDDRLKLKIIEIKALLAIAQELSGIRTGDVGDN